MQQISGGGLKRAVAKKIAGDGHNINEKDS